MGILRLLFALSVVIFHSGHFFDYNLVNRTIAVLSFFVISGFYMSLILDKKYTKKKHYYLFWSNRFLRIFPLYWLALGIIVGLAAVKFLFHLGVDDNLFVHYFNLSTHTKPVEYALNLTNFILRNITLIITADYFHVNDSTGGYLIVLQAWSLQIELLFYAVAPFLANLSKKVFLFVSGFLVLLFYGVMLPDHILSATLTYYFMSYLLYFLLGMASYTFGYKKLQNKKIHPKILWTVFLLMIGYVVLYNFLPLTQHFTPFTIQDPLYFIVFALALPYIFMLTRKSAVDMFLGKFSYPVYILHLIVIKLFSNFSMFNHDSDGKTIIMILATLVLSYAAIRFIEIPIDKVRQKRVHTSKAQMVT